MAGSALLLSEMHTRILALLIPLSLALRFEIAASHGEGTLKCFSQFFTKGAHVFGHVDVPAQDAQRIDIEAKDSEETANILWNKDGAVNDYDFSFTTPAESNVHFCFTAVLDKDTKPSDKMKRQVYIRIWQGQKHEHVDDSKYKMLFKEFDIVDDTLIESFDDMHFLMDTDEEMYRQNVAIKSSVDRFALASILLLICVGAWQVWFLGYYFKSRKII